MIIYGKEGCSRCEQVKKMNPDAEVKPFTVLYDSIDIDKANIISLGSGGSLPILKIGGHYFAPLEV